MKKANFPTTIRNILVVFIGAGLSASCVSTTGRRIPVEHLETFKPLETTSAEVESALGHPESLIKNTGDNTTILSYQWVVSTFVGIGLPPWIIVGRKSDCGYQLNVVLVGDVFAGYVKTTWHQGIFKRLKPRDAAPLERP